MKSNHSEAFQALAKITRDWPKPMPLGRLLQQVVLVIIPDEAEYNHIRRLTSAALGEEGETWAKQDR